MIYVVGECDYQNSFDQFEDFEYDKAMREAAFTANDYETVYVIRGQRIEIDKNILAQVKGEIRLKEEEKMRKEEERKRKYDYGRYLELKAKFEKEND